MSDDVHGRVLDGPDHPIRHRRLVHVEAGVHRCDDDVQPCQNLILQVEGTVREDVHFDAAEDVERREPRAELLDRECLGRQSLGIETLHHSDAG